MSVQLGYGCESAYYGPALTQLSTCSGSTFLIFMAAVDSIIRNNSKINDPCGRIVPKNVSALNLEYDFIVVGGGSGGSVVAGRLAEISNAKILLIEAGPDEPTLAEVPGFAPGFKRTSIDYGYQTEAEAVGCQQSAGHKCSLPHGRVLGGTGVLNAMIYMRPIPKDLERWAEAGNPRWTYDQVLPFLKKSEDNKNFHSDVHGTGGPWTITKLNYQESILQDIIEAAQQTGFNITPDLNNGVNLTGITLFQTNSRNGQRLTTARAFLRPQRNNLNLHILLNSTVSKILINEENGIKSAYGVQFLKDNVTYTVKANKEIILAAGAIATPQILLLSGIGDNKILAEVGIKQIHNLTGVGKGLKDHIGFRRSYLLNENDTNLLSWDSLHEYINNASGPLSSNGLFQFGGRIASNYTTLNDPDIQMTFSGYSPNCAYNGEFNAPANASNPSARRTVDAGVSNVHTKSTGYVALKTKNINDHPKIVSNYFTEDEDLRVLLYGLRESQKMLKAPSLIKKHGFTAIKKEYGNCLSLYGFDTDDYWICAFKQAHYAVNHQGCTCKMGSASNPDNCVNELLQLHGIENLRIADASVFPTLPRANVQSSVVLVAERAAHFIKQKYYKNI